MTEPLVEVEVKAEQGEGEVGLLPMKSNIQEAQVEERERLMENAKATKSVLNQIESQAKSCTTLIQEWIGKVKSGEFSTEKGLTFLEMKNHTLLNYLISLTGLIMNKCSGKSIQGSSYLDQLIETRIILEKIRPIDQKLKYQIDKLVRIAVEGKVEANDPLRFKANPCNMMTGNPDGSDEDEISSDEEGAATIKPNTDGVYRPPKVAPQHFDDDVPTAKSGAASADKSRRKVFNRSLIRELQEQYLETPVEVHNMGDAFAKQLSRDAKQKERYEETYMTRLAVTKKDKHNQRSLSTLGVLGDEITDFSGKRSQGGTAGKSKAKKRKSGGKGKSAKKRRKH